METKQITITTSITINGSLPQASEIHWKAQLAINESDYFGPAQKRQMHDRINAIKRGDVDFSKKENLDFITISTLEILHEIVTAVWKNTRKPKFPATLSGRIAEKQWDEAYYGLVYLHNRINGYYKEALKAV